MELFDFDCRSLPGFERSWGSMELEQEDGDDTLRQEAMVIIRKI